MDTEIAHTLPKRGSQAFGSPPYSDSDMIPVTSQSFQIAAVFLPTVAEDDDEGKESSSEGVSESSRRFSRLSSTANKKNALL